MRQVPYFCAGRCRVAGSTNAASACPVLAIPILLAARAPGLVFAFSILLIAGAPGVVVAFSIALTARALGIVFASPILRTARAPGDGDGSTLLRLLSCLLLTQARLSSRVHGSSGRKAIRKFNLVGVRKEKKAGCDEEKAGGGQRAVPGRAISTLPPRQGRAPTAVLSPARRSAAVRMGRGGTARQPEAEWSSGVAAFLGGCYNQDIFKDPKERLYDDVSVLYNKDSILVLNSYQVLRIYVFGQYQVYHMS